MRMHGRDTVQLGQLVVFAFDEAAQRSTDPGEVSRLATTAVMRILHGARRAPMPGPGRPPPQPRGARR